jgi:hypothetical protein
MYQASQVRQVLCHIICLCWVKDEKVVAIVFVFVWRAVLAPPRENHELLGKYPS